MSGTVISYPTPAYSNFPIQSQFYVPSRFVISSINTGQTTTITTSADHNYVIGQLVRLIIPSIFGSYELNETQGYVISIPTSSSVVVSINSVGVNTFIHSPYTSSITNISQSSSAIVTSSNAFLGGNIIIINEVGGMSQINGKIVSILSANSSSFTINLDTTSYSAYTSGGTASLYHVSPQNAQILAIGDINTGATNNSGRANNITYIPGSFIDISPK